MKNETLKVYGVCQGGGATGYCSFLLIFSCKPRRKSTTIFFNEGNL